MPRTFFGSGFFAPPPPEGGTPAYASLQDVIDAISAGDLAEGDAWRVAWAGDAYLSDGVAVGLVVNGVPSWTEPIPLPVLGFSGSSFGAVAGGAVALDGDGRPLLSVATGATDAIRWDMGFEGRPARTLRFVGVFTAASATSAAEQIVEARLADPTQVNYLGVGIRYFGGWQFIQMTQGSTGSGIVLSGAPAIGAFAAGVRFDLIVTRGKTYLVNPGFGGRIAAASGPAAQATAELTGSAGVGSWNNTSAEIRATLAMNGAGTAGNFLITGFAMEV